MFDENMRDRVYPLLLASSVMSSILTSEYSEEDMKDYPEGERDGENENTSNS